MPIRFRPGGKVPVYLAAFTADETPPTFYVRNITGAEAMDFADLFDNMKKASGRDGIKKAFDALRNVIVGWDNLNDEDGKAIAFDPAIIEQIFTLAQVGELIGSCLRGASLTDDQRGK